MFDSVGNFYFGESLQHHGIKGQRWGDRNGPPYPLDKTKYSKYEKAHLRKARSRKKFDIKKGHRFDRVQSTNKDESEKSSLMYVTSGDDLDRARYAYSIGLSNVRNKGKAYVTEYISNEDIKVPSLNKQNKIQRNLVDDPKIRDELFNSLVEKGVSKENATKMLRTYNKGIEYTKHFIDSSLMTAAAVGINAAIYAAGYVSTGGAMLIPMAAMTYFMRPRQVARRDKALDVSLGDQKNEMVRLALKDLFKKEGYNAIRDTNDRRNGMRARSALILLDPKSVRLKTTRQMSRDDFGQLAVQEAYRQMIEAGLKPIQARMQIKAYKNEYEEQGKKAYDTYLEYYKNSKKKMESDDKKLKEELDKKAA